MCATLSALDRVTLLYYCTVLSEFATVSDLWRSFFKQMNFNGESVFNSVLDKGLLKLNDSFGRPPLNFNSDHVNVLKKSALEEIHYAHNRFWPKLAFLY